jgi:hypothetical protein
MRTCHNKVNPFRDWLMIARVWEKARIEFSAACLLYEKGYMLIFS